MMSNSEVSSVKHEDLFLQGTSEKVASVKTLSPTTGNSETQKANVPPFHKQM